ncbi:MAG: Multidrug resistance protein MdtA [Legionellaceae bacterium]
MSLRLLHVILFIVTLSFSYKNIAYAQDTKMPPTVVETAKVKSQDWQEKITATGTLSAKQGAILRSEIVGRITQIYFQPGQEVKQGALLIDINPGILEGDYQSKEAQLKLNRINYQRARDLYSKQLYPKAELDKQYAALKMAEADLMGSLAKLTQAKIRAPFPGKVGLNKVNIGDYVSVGQDLVSIQLINPMRIDFDIPETYVSQLALGQKVSLKIANKLNETFEGKVTGIDTVIQPKTRSISVRAEMMNNTQSLLPGAFAEVILYLGSKHSMLTVPQQAIFYDQGKPFLFKIGQDKAIKTEVKLGHRIDNDILIENGISDNDEIITAGQFKLMDQAPVIVKK